MGWLDLIFGKGTTRRVATAKKVAKTLTPQSTKQEKKPQKPKLIWSKSENGNDTTIYDGFRVTLFQQDGLWNYCVVEILDDEDRANGDEDEPIFGDQYPTKAEAKREALAEVGYP